MKGLSDELIAVIFDLPYHLEQIHLTDIPLGTLTIEAICSNYPNLHELSIIGSDVITDVDVRCIASVILHLSRLTISRCNALTESGFTRMTCLRSLKHADFSYSSRNVTGNIIKYLECSPLESLKLDGLRFIGEFDFSSLHSHCTTKLTSISLCNTSGINISQITSMLHQYIALTSIDFTNCSVPSVADLSKVVHWNPFLSFSFTADNGLFCRASQHQRSLYTQHWSSFHQFLRYWGARAMQRLFRYYQRRLEEIRIARRENWSAFKISSVIRIQAYHRGYLARKHYHKQRKATALIIKAVIKFLQRLSRKKLRDARIHRKNILKKSSFQKLLLNYLQDTISIIL
jgi:hypothetical protein